MNRSILTIAIAAALTATLPAQVFAGDAAAGKVVFDTNCMTCHGMTGKGDGPVGKALNPPPRDFTTADFKFDADGNGTAGEDADVKAVVQKGAAAFGGSALMAPWPTLSDEDVDNVTAYIRSLKQ